MIRYSKNLRLQVVITIDDTFTEEEKKKLAEAVAIYKESPKSKGLRVMFDAFITAAKLSRRWISEQNITKLRRLMHKAPSRMVMMALRQQGLMEGTYFREIGKGRHGYIVYYDVEKVLKRLAQLETIGYAVSMRLHKEGRLDHLYKDEASLMKDRKEIREANEERRIHRSMKKGERE